MVHDVRLFISVQRVCKFTCWGEVTLAASQGRSERTFAFSEPPSTPPNPIPQLPLSSLAMLKVTFSKRKGGLLKKVLTIASPPFCYP